MTTFAEKTTVSSEKSRAEIEATLKRYGADAFGYMTDTRGATVGFQCKGKLIRLKVMLADGKNLVRRSGQACNYPTDSQRAEWVEQQNRQRWRALLLVIKAKLEAVESGIALFEDEFLPYTVLPTGETFADWARPQLAELSATGRMPQMLLSAGV